MFTNPQRSRLVLTAIGAVALSGIMACTQSTTTPASPSGMAALGGPEVTAAKPSVQQDVQLNLSHVECVDGKVEIHFVLLFVPDGVTPGNFISYNWGGGTRQAPRGKNTGNVWHYTDTLPSGSTVNITSATVQVSGQAITLHNAGAYAGTYNCGSGLCNLQNPVPTLMCLDQPLGNEISECSFFAPGASPLGKTNLDGTTGPQQTTQAAALAIVKDGKAGCEPGQNSYRTYTNVTSGQLLSPPGGGNSISHITYCSCPAAR